MPGAIWTPEDRRDDRDPGSREEFPRVCGTFEWEAVDPADPARILSSGYQQNRWLDQGRQAILTHWWQTEGGEFFSTNFLHMGTGTAAVQGNDTALQCYVTAMTGSGVGLVQGDVVGGFTGRKVFVLSPIQMTGLITEVMVAHHTGNGDSGAAFARSLLSANHVSGQLLRIKWYAALQA